MTDFSANIHRKEKYSKPSDGPFIQKSNQGPVLNIFKQIAQEFKNIFIGTGININQYPPHMSPPRGARTVNFIALDTIPAGTAVPIVLWEYQHKENNILNLTHYAIFNDALLISTSYFIPLLNGNKIFPYHGNPSDKFRIGLGNGPDMNNSALNPINISMKKGDHIQWMVVNTAIIDVDMGARMTGYVDTSSKQLSRPFGG